LARPLDELAKALPWSGKSSRNQSRRSTPRTPGTQPGTVRPRERELTYKPLKLDQKQAIFLKYYSMFVGMSFVVVASCIALLIKQVMSPRNIAVMLLIYLSTSLFVLSNKLKKKYD
jgi:hypothetical protein